MDVVVFVIGAIFAGFLVGILSGLLGIGGGTIMVAVFRLAYGLNAIASTATSLFTIIPTSLSGAITHIRGKTAIPKLGIAVGVGGAMTSPIGVWLASISPEWAILLGAALVMTYSAITMFRKAFKAYRESRRESEVITGCAESTEGAGNTPEVFEDKTVEIGRKQIIICSAVGIAAGLVSGYVGVGGGFIIVPILMQLLNLPLKKVSGTSLIAVMILAIPGTITQALLGNVDWILGICVALGSIPGATVGSKLVKKVPETALRFIFGGFLIVAAIALLLD